MQRPRPWVIVPGIWNSDPEHWQSRWQAAREAEDGRVVRILPASWGEPEPDDWQAAITRAVEATDEPPVLVAHSLGVLAAARWLASPEASTHPVAGALLVAPPDPDGPGFPDAARGFTAPAGVSHVEDVRLVVSDDDPYCSADRAIEFATVLGATVHRIGAVQHVNVAAGVGWWHEGRALLDAIDGSARSAGAEDVRSA
ncbi:alpha/beta hydrolase [Curtobacterium sp. B8]|uniref:RBBP9/YdeN family alpha/beta hydrolase n=1 Tax=Curtobacterium sp. B8 TaxID=95611 RepID=UPI00034C319E|nr:alpha/beta hydrolase [Curtobacterium sp. B8]